MNTDKRTGESRSRIESRRVIANSACKPIPFTAESDPFVTRKSAITFQESIMPTKLHTDSRDIIMMNLIGAFQAKAIYRRTILI